MLPLTCELIMRTQAILISTIVFSIVATISIASAQTTTPEPSPTPTPTPSINATSTPEPTPTPEPVYTVGIQVINGTSALKQATVVIDEDVANTGFSGTADFKCSYGLHNIQIYYNNINYYNGSLVITKPDIHKIDITEYLPHESSPPVENLVETTNEDYSTVAFLIIALTVLCIALIWFKRRQN
jgi:hypothetical protein